MMKMEMVDLVNAYDASEWILDKDIKADFAFRIAELIDILRSKRDIFNTAVQKVKVLPDGKLDPNEFNALCAKEVEVNLPEIKASELKEEFEKIPPKVVLSLLPLLIRDDKEPKLESVETKSE